MSLPVKVGREGYTVSLIHSTSWLGWVTSPKAPLGWVTAVPTMAQKATEGWSSPQPHLRELREVQ